MEANRNLLIMNDNELHKSTQEPHHFLQVPSAFTILFTFVPNSLNPCSLLHSRNVLLLQKERGASGEFLTFLCQSSSTFSDPVGGVIEPECYRSRQKFPHAVSSQCCSMKPNCSHTGFSKTKTAPLSKCYLQLCMSDILSFLLFVFIVPIKHMSL